MSFEGGGFCGGKGGPRSFDKVRCNTAMSLSAVRADVSRVVMLVLFNFDPPVTTPRKLAVCLFFAFGGERAFVLGALSLKRGDKAG